MELALFAFAFVAMATPGPNNFMLMTSGTNFGLRFTLPHLFGIVLGFCYMLTLVGVGITRVFIFYPVLEQILQVVCSLYLLYLAFRMWQSGSPTNPTQLAQPLSFWEAACFQWTNPKAWSVALATVSLYAPSHALIDVVSVTFVFLIVGVPACFVWVSLGNFLRKLLNEPHRMLRFNQAMAVVLVVTVFLVYY